MSIIKVAVDDQALYVTESPVIAAQGVNENYFQFALSSDWAGFGTVALFWKEGNETDVYESVVDGTGKALVPHEVTDSQGRICVGLAGSKGNIIHTSEVLKYKVVKGKYTAGQSSEPPTPGIYEQMLALAGQMDDQFRQVVEEQSEVIEDLQADQTALRSELTAQQTTFQDTISGQMDTFIAGQAGDYGVTVLWDMNEDGDGNGILGKDTTVTLRYRAADYDYLDIYSFNKDLDSITTIPVDENLDQNGYAVRSLNVGSGNVAKFRAVEYRLQIVGTTLTIAESYVYWYDTSNHAEAITQANKSQFVGVFGISKIVGRKMVQNAELVDVRVGENGTTYQTAGAAVRGQFAEVKSQIPLIDASLATAGKAADAKAVGDELAGLNGRLTQQSELTSDLKADAATSFSWVQGGINTNIGTNTEDNTRIRSSGFKSYDGCESVTVTIPAEYQAVAIELNGNGSPQRDYFVRSIPDSGYTAQSFSFIPVDGYYYRFCIKRTSNADISPAQVPSGFAVTEQRKRIPNIFETMFNTNVGNSGILCAKEHNFIDGSAPTYEWYLLGDPATNKVYYSKDMTKKEYLFTFGENLGYWSFGIDSNNNIICCKQSEYLSDSLEHDDDLRVNPIVYLFSEKYSIPHEVDFGESLKPCGWLSSVGFICLADGSCLIAEYTRPVVSTANIWKISGTPTNAANWSVRQTFELSGSGTGFKHIHCVQQDFYTGVCYFSTGDDDTSSHWYYSTDNGTTWVLGKGNSEKYCRFLNLIFTPNYVYWSTDSNKVGYHWIFRAGRNANGVVDFSNITDLHEIPLVSSLATYGCCYFPEYNALLLMERCDSEIQFEMPVRLYDIGTDTLHTVWTFTPASRLAESGGHLGFRTRFCTWYPKGNAIRCAWHLRGTSIGSRGFNENAMFGNIGSPYTENNINNAEIRIYKDGNTYRMTLDTAYI